jgi:EmrB/QacA subfamily drug resistance transporter
MSIIGLGALLFGIIEGPSRGWTDPLVVVGFTAGLIVLAAFIVWELHTDEPMLDMRFFKNPRFSVANSAITLTFFAMFGSLFLMTQYWQLVHGYSPLQAGVRLIPYALTMMLVAPLSARAVERFGTKRIVTAGLVVMATALLLLSFIQRDTSYFKVIFLFCMMSVGMGLTMPPATESVMGSLPREKAGVGSAVNDTTRQVGGALGVAVIGSIVSSAYASRIGEVLPGFGVVGNGLAQAKESLANALGLAPQSTDAAGLTAAARDSFVHALSLGLRFSAFVVVVAAVLAWKYLPARAADHQLTPAEALATETVGAYAAQETARADSSVAPVLGEQLAVAGE